MGSRTRTPGVPRGPGSGTKALLELQIHPQDIRKRVRYLFLSRREVTIWAVAGGVWLLLCALAVALAPGVVADLWRSHEQAALVAEKVGQEERLLSLVAGMERVRDESEELRLLIDKVFLLYGLSTEVTGGQGGYPLPADSPSGEAGVPPLVYGRQVEASLSQELRVAELFLGEIQAFEDARHDQIRLTPSTSPLRRAEFVLTSPFGNRRNPFTKMRDFHAGLDMAAPRGTRIYAPADGVVLFAGRYSLQKSVAWWRYGNTVLLAHGDDFITVYGHCLDVTVRPGQRVSQGDVIATVGSTGMSTNPHLHYEVRRLGEDEVFRPVDPRIYILDHRWRNEEQILVRSRQAPPASDFQPLPPLARQ